MLNISKYENEKLTYSEEGFMGGLAGFIFGMVPVIGGVTVGAGGKLKLQKINEDIIEISSRITKIRNGQIDAAVKKGTKLPTTVKHVDEMEVVKGALLGVLFGPIYGIFIGSDLENENKKLQAKIKELNEELTKAGIVLE